MTRHLVPLRVPAGWAVLFNIFIEMRSADELSVDEVASYLSDDVLSMEELSFSSGRWVVDPDGAVVDLSWRDPGVRGGEYVLVVKMGTSGGTATYRAKSSDPVRQAIELAFEVLQSTRSVDTLNNQYQKLMEP